MSNRRFLTILLVIAAATSARGTVVLRLRLAGVVVLAAIALDALVVRSRASRSPA